MERTSAELKQIYSRRFSPEENRAKDRIWSIIVTQFFQKWVQPSDVVLDIGCGYGEFLRHIRCGRKIGVDLNPDSATALSQAGVEYLQQSVCERYPLPDASVDFAFTSNLMEHLPDKPGVEQMIREVHRVLKPGGHFVMMGPNIQVIPGSYWDFWDHLVPISELSLIECLECLGFRIVNSWGRFLPYTTKSSIPKASWLVSLYLKCPWIWGFMGQQFLVRATK